MRLLVLTLIVVSASTATRPGTRIYGGQDATSGQFPFIVALNDPEIQFCDGAIIDTQWILTAAHCLQHIPPKATVLVGTHIEHSGGTEYPILRTIIHEDFYANATNDIGLIQIDGTLEYSDTVQPIEFGGGDVNETCTIIGWGVTDTVSFPEIVQYVDVTAIDLDLCKEMAKGITDNYYLGPEQVCTLAEEGKGACFGDSGGPLVCGGKLSGLVSYGVVACAQGYPDVFTRPSAYADWIKRNKN